MSEDEETPSAKSDDERERMDLPKWNRARVKRASPSNDTDDAFTGGVRRAGRFTVQRVPVVLGAIVLVGAFAAGAQWYLAHQRSQTAVSTRLLADAAGARARGRVADVKALLEGRKHPFPEPIFEDRGAQASAVDEALSNLAAEAPGSSADDLAELIRAARDFERREFAAAEARYRSFLDAHRKHELLFLAREGLALAAEAQGRSDEALEALQPLLDDAQGFYRSRALWHRARMLEDQGKPEEAKLAYQLYLTDYPLGEPSLAREQVRARLQTFAPELLPADEEAAPGDLGGGGAGR